MSQTRTPLILPTEIQEEVQFGRVYYNNFNYKETVHRRKTMDREGPEESTRVEQSRRREKQILIET